MEAKIVAGAESGAGAQSKTTHTQAGGGQVERVKGDPLQPLAGGCSPSAGLEASRAPPGASLRGRRL